MEYGNNMTIDERSSESGSENLSLYSYKSSQNKKSEVRSKKRSSKFVSKVYSQNQNMETIVEDDQEVFGTDFKKPQEKNQSRFEFTPSYLPSLIVTEEKTCSNEKEERLKRLSPIEHLRQPSTSHNMKSLFPNDSASSKNRFAFIFEDNFDEQGAN